MHNEPLAADNVAPSCPLTGALEFQEIMMRALVVAVAMLLVAGDASLADTASSRFRAPNGKMTVAQSYCRMCADDRTTCVIKCNGAGVCIQNCDYDYQLCIERACRYPR